MLKEILCATAFLGRVIGNRVPLTAREGFLSDVAARLEARFQGHWNPDKPMLGSAFRCVRWEAYNPEPLLVQSARLHGVVLEDVLPRELILWIDPNEVCAQIGEHGSIFPLLDSHAAPLPATQTSPSQQRKSPTLRPTAPPFFPKPLVEPVRC